MDPALSEILHHHGGAEVIEVVVRMQNAAAIPEGLQVIARFGNVATCRLRCEKIPALWADEAVASLKAPRVMALEGEPPATEAHEREIDSAANARRPKSLPETGRGIVIGIIDWGCDFAHPNFRREDGATRLLALWDQTNDRSPKKPLPYGYGRVYSQEEIDRALQTPAPYATLGYHPAQGDPYNEGAHGTHVMDIAAGNGRAGKMPLGIAPEAELVFVHLSAGGTTGLANLGDSVRILEAIDFVAQIAGPRPIVINMSVGRTGGSHTGDSLVEQGIDAFLNEAPARALVQSTGNYYRSNIHAAGRLQPGQTRALTWQIERADLTPNEMEIWYSGRDVFSVEIQPPNSAQKFRAALGESCRIKMDGREAGRLYHRTYDPNNGDHHVNVFLDAAATPGVWQVHLIGEDIVDGRYHAWVERDLACRQCQSRFDPQEAVALTTTGTICNGLRNIAVGAYDAHAAEFNIADFSSSGPTRDGRQKPDLLAPGVDIEAARSAPAQPNSIVPLLARKSGTSMAAPHVTGTIALMFEAAEKPLPIQDTRRLLLQSARPVEISGEAAWRVGSGVLDIEAAVHAARQYTPAAITEVDDNLEKEKMLLDHAHSTRENEFRPDVPAGAKFDESLSCRCQTPSPKLSELDEFLSPASIFDAFALPSRRAARLRPHYERLFEIVVAPREKISRRLRPGDFWLQRALGEGSCVRLAVLGPGDLSAAWSQRLGYDQMILRRRPVELSRDSLDLAETSKIPLDPGIGGLSIDTGALDIADIILSTTNEWISQAIRKSTNAEVSHSMLYIGDGNIVEAIGSGVVLRTLKEAIHDASAAIAFRDPEMTAEKALRIRNFVNHQIGKKYNYMGIVRQARFRLDLRAFCRHRSGAQYDACKNWVGRIRLGAGSNDSFFCSELIIAAFQDAGLPLIDTPPHWNSPADIAELRFTTQLGYVGHLKT